MYRMLIYCSHDISARDTSASRYINKRYNYIQHNHIKEEFTMDKNLPLTEALFYILLAVRKPNHGYGITDFLKAHQIVGTD